MNTETSETEYMYEVWQGGTWQAGGSATDYATAKSEADHYAMVYGQDGPAEVRIYEKRLLVDQPPAAARGDVRGLEYEPGRLDRTAPPRVWLQIDTTGDNDERDDAWPGPEHVTWQDESIGGLEIQYVRADLALVAEGVQAGEVEQQPEARGVVDVEAIRRACQSGKRFWQAGPGYYEEIESLLPALTGERNG